MQAVLAEELIEVAVVEDGIVVVVGAPLLENEIAIEISFLTGVALVKDRESVANSIEPAILALRLIV